MSARRVAGDAGPGVVVADGSRLLPRRRQTTSQAFTVLTCHRVLPVRVECSEGCVDGGVELLGGLVPGEGRVVGDCVVKQGESAHVADETALDDGLDEYVGALRTVRFCSCGEDRPAT